MISEAKNPTIGYYAFEGIASNAILSIPPFSEDAYENCTQYFADYTTDLKVGNLYFNLDDDGDGTAWVEKSILDKKPYSGDIVIPSSVTYEGVEYPVVGIDDNAFKDATITSVVIPDGVKYIEDAAFYNCENLTSIVIPKTVRSIGESAFMYCDEVESLVCLVKNPFPICGKGEEGATFSNYFFNNVPLYVAKGTAETYRETEGWKDFVNIIEGLPDSIKGVEETKGRNTEWFDLDGRRQNILHHGINILRDADGSVKKVVKK